MNESRHWWQVLALGILSTALLATASLGQEEEDPVQLKPNPEGHIVRSPDAIAVSPPDVLPLSRVSSRIRTMNGRSYVPVADFAQALGSPTRPRPGDPGDAIHLQAGRGGVLELEPSSVPSGPSFDRPRSSGEAGHKVQKVRPGATRGAESHPASTVPGGGSELQAQPGSLFVGSILVSRGIIIINSRPMVPVDDLAAALGAKIVPHGGGLAFEKIPGRQGALSF